MSFCHFIYFLIYWIIDFFNFFTSDIKTNNNSIASKMHLYACFLKCSQWSFFRGPNIIKIRKIYKFTFYFWMIIMMIKKKWQNNPLMLANIKEIIENKRPWGSDIYISPRMLLSCSVTGRTERHDFEPRQSFDHFFAVSFSAIPCARYSFKDCFTVIFLPRGNEIGS